MKIRILDLAETDLLTGMQFYERQSEGLGSYFVETLSSDVESLRLYAGIHAKKFGFLRMLSRRFPYAIYYRIQATEVHVWRILDCRRDPGWTDEQLKSDQAGSARRSPSRER